MKNWNWIKPVLLLLTLIQTGTVASLTGGYTIGCGLLGSALFLKKTNTGGEDSPSFTGDLGRTAKTVGWWSSNSTRLPPSASAFYRLELP
jgi:hypothetical protein